MLGPTAILEPKAGLSCQLVLTSLILTKVNNNKNTSNNFQFDDRFFSKLKLLI